MTNPIQLKRSTTAGNTPSSLASGEVAVNIPDRLLFVNDGTGTVRSVNLTGDAEKISSTQPIGAALLTKPNKAGDTYSGQHFIPLAGQRPPNDDITQRIEGGSYLAVAATYALGWPENGNSYMHLLGTTHPATSNYYALQIAGGYFDNDHFYVRKTNNVGTQPWRELWHTGNFNPSNQTIVTEKLRPTLGGQVLAYDALGQVDGYVPYWNGSGTTLNRTDSGAIGQGRIFAPMVMRWTDRLDNGTSNGTSADPHGQPSNGINTVSLQLLEHTVGGGTGVRETQRINTIFDTPSATWNVNRNYVASRRRVSVTVAESGSSNRPSGDTGFTGGSGAFFADNPEAYAGPNATNLLELALSEGNIGIMQGGSARILYGHSVVRNSYSQADVIDAAFASGAFSGGTPFKDQILISDAHGGTPLDPNGTIMRVGQYNGTTQSVGTIFDFSKLSTVTRILEAPLVDWRPSVFALTTGSLTMQIPGLPTTDPHVLGQWWRDPNAANVIKMSVG